jgi:hypothetical protein
VKRTARFTARAQAARDERRYWLSRPVAERVAAVELLRRRTPGIYADELPPDWNEFIASLRAHRVRFVIVGAHALAANGRPRATQSSARTPSPCWPSATSSPTSSPRGGRRDLRGVELLREGEPARRTPRRRR